VVQQLSEPVTSEDLDVVLRRWAGAHSTAPAPNDAVPAARAALATLIDEIGPAPARTAWTAFVRGTDTRYATARHAVGDRDATALAAAAHSVRGSAAAIGLPALARLGADLEAAARREDFDRATDLLSSLQHYREAVRVVAPVLPAPRTPGDAEPNSVDPRPTAGAPPRRRLLKWFGDQ
jgi:HPt (histidine-containing phosphotransfer) domain-containing protein